MAVYTRVTPDELDGFLAHYDIGERTAFRGIPAGTVNSNFFVSTCSVDAVLTLFERLPAKEIPYFLALMAWLSEHGLPSAHPIADRNGEYLRALNGRSAALFQRLDGMSVPTPSVAHCRAVGSAIGRLHAVASDFPQRRANPHGPNWWRATGRQLMPVLSVEQAELLQEELHFQSLYHLPDLPRGPIHGDLFRDNVLFEESRVSGLIDFYFACDERLLFDLAITVNDWCSEADGSLEAERTAAMLESYHGERPLTHIERGAWPAMLRAAALRWWLSRLLDVRESEGGALGKQKDPVELERLLRVRVKAHDKMHVLFPEL